jgi:hypothetical protein
MEQTLSLLGKLPPHIAIDLMIDTHGPWATIRALITALLNRHQRRIGTMHLCDHLRRDIGLPERGAPPPSLRGPLM